MCRALRVKNLTIDANYKRLVEKFNTAPWGTPKIILESTGCRFLAKEYLLIQ